MLLQWAEKANTLTNQEPRKGQETSTRTLLLAVKYTGPFLLKDVCVFLLLSVDLCLYF